MNKASEGDETSAQLFQILKEDAVEVLHSIYQQIWKAQCGHRAGKGQFSFQFQRKAMPKIVQTTAQLHSSHANKVMLKNPTNKASRYMNRELSDVQAGFRKGRGTRGQIANIHWIIKKARENQKIIYFYFMDYVKTFDYIQFSSVTQLCPTLCNLMNRSTPGLPVHHQLPEFTQTRVHRVDDAIQPSHPLLSPSPPAPNPSQHQGLFQ